MMKQSGFAVLVAALATLMSPALLRAENPPGSLQSASFLIPAYAINSGGSSLTSASYLGTACVGDLGVSRLKSASFEMRPGFCALQQWLLIQDEASDIDVSGMMTVRTTFGLPGPNPAFGAVHLSFSIGEGETGTLQIFDVAGRRVRTLADDQDGPLVRVVDWDLRNDHGLRMSSGVYFARLHTKGQSLSRRIVVLDR